MTEVASGHPRTRHGEPSSKTLNAVSTHFPRAAGRTRGGGFPRLARLVAAVVLCLAAADSAAAQTPALSAAEKRAFLLNAPIVASRPAGKGITGSLRVTLDDGKVRHDAGFQSVNERKPQKDGVSQAISGSVIFVDSYRYNIAAYQLAELLGLGHMMPVTVKRSWNDRVGSLSWWVDDVLMDEGERQDKRISPPDVPAWARQRQSMWIFSELVRDTDRNKGNVLYTKTWDVVMIDFTRAFRLERTLSQPELLTQIDRRLLERLQAITADEVKKAVGDLLTQSEFESVMVRRTRLLQHYQQLIKERGEQRIVY